MRFIIQSFVLLMLVSSSSLGYAKDLLQVFDDALAFDPQLKADEATWRAAQQDVSIARAQMLPALTATTGITRSFNQRTSNAVNLQTSYYNTDKQYGLTLTQPLFNIAIWSAFNQARAATRAAGATFLDAQQKAILRAATAYFNVLQAYDNLRYTIAQRQAIGEQLRQTKERYKVGLIPSTSMYEAQAAYDSVTVQEIVARSDLATQLERLLELTGKSYSHLMGIKEEVALMNPEPMDMVQWVNRAKEQNYSLQAARYTMQAAKENITQQQAGHLPSVTGQASYNYGDTSDTSLGPTRTQTAALTASINLPVYAGGGVVAKSRQAIEQYGIATAAYEQAYRATIAAARTAYLDVITGINRVKADRQAVRSNQSSLTATQDAYQVGTRTILDVLNAQSSLYNVQRAHAQDQYQYLLSLLNLKQAAGTLQPSDLAMLNARLTQEIHLADKGAEAVVQVKKSVSVNKKN